VGPQRGTFRRVVTALAADLHARGGLDLSETFIDGSFASAKKGCVGKTKRGKGTKIMAIADGAGLPLAVTIASASTTLVTQTLNASFLPDTPARLIGDAAYDSDGLDQRLADCGIEMIAPHRSNRVNLRQDGRALRRYKRRRKIERLFAWLQNSRRLTRYERRAANFMGFLHLACAMILLRHL
jgi:transposase